MKCKVDCSECKTLLAMSVNALDIIIVHNLDTDKFVYTFNCPRCNGREAHPINEAWADKLIAYGSMYRFVENPDLSGHPKFGPPISTFDVSSFITELNFNDDCLVKHIQKAA